MTRWGIAFLLACLVHEVFFVLAWAFMEPSRTVVAPPQLDVTSVELSLAETESATAPAAVSEPQSAETQKVETPEHEVSPTLAPPLPKAPSAEVVADMLEPAPPSPLHVSRPFLEVTAPEPVPAPAKPKQTVTARAVVSRPASPPVAAPQQAQVTAPVRAVRTIHPKYPRESRERHEEGDVTVEIAVNARGLVEGVKIVESCGFALLERAALEAVRKARFTPARRGDEPVAATARLVLSFRLR